MDYLERVKVQYDLIRESLKRWFLGLFIVLQLTEFIYKVGLEPIELNLFNSLTLFNNYLKWQK